MLRQGTRLRQVAIVVRDLEPALRALSAALGAPVVERDPGLARFGLHNGLLQVGDCFLEVVAPLPPPPLPPTTTTTPGTGPAEEDNTTADSAGGRYLARFGDGGYMLLVQVPSLAACEARMVTDMGLTPIFASGRARDGRDREHTPVAAAPPDEGGITGTHFHPRDMGCIVEVTESSPPNEWMWAGRAWLQKGRGGGSGGESPPHSALAATTCGHFAGVVVAVSDPERTCATWARGGLGRRCSPTTLQTTGDGALITFRRPRHAKENGPVRVDMWSRDPELDGVTCVIGGVAFRWVASVRSSRL